MHTHAVDGYFNNMHSWPDTPWSTSDKEIMSAHYRLNVGGAQGNHLRLTVQQKDLSDRIWKESMTAADVHKLLWNRSGDVLVSYEIISPNDRCEVMSPPDAKLGLPSLGPPGSVGFKQASDRGPEAYLKYGTQVLPVMPRMASDADQRKGKYSASLPAKFAEAPPFPAHMDPQYLQPKQTGRGAGASTPAVSVAGSTDLGRSSPSGFGAAEAGAGAGGRTIMRATSQVAQGTAGAAVREGVGTSVQLVPLPVAVVNPSSSALATDRANTLPQLSQRMQPPTNGRIVNSHGVSSRGAAAGGLPLPSLIASTSPPSVGTNGSAAAHAPVPMAVLATTSSGSSGESPPSRHSSSFMASPQDEVGSDRAAGGMDAMGTGSSTASTVPEVPASSAAGAVLSPDFQSFLAQGKQRKLKVDVDDIAVRPARASSTSEPAVQRVAKRSQVSDAASSVASTGLSARGATASARSQTSARSGHPTTAGGYSRRAKGKGLSWKKAISAPLPDWGSHDSPSASGFVLEVVDVDTWRMVLQYLTTLIASSSGFDRHVDMDLACDGQPTVHPVMYVPLLVFQDVNVNGPHGGDLKELCGAAKSEADKHQRDRKFIADHEQISVTHGVPPHWALFLGPGKQVCFGLDAYRQIGGSPIEDGLSYHGHRVCALIPLLRGDVQAVTGDAATHTVHIMLSQSGLQGVAYQFDCAMHRVDGYSSLRLLPESAREQRRAAKAWAESSTEEMIYPRISGLGSARASQSGSLSGSASAGGSLLPDLLSSPAAGSRDGQSTSTAAQVTGLRMLGRGSSSGAASSRDSAQEEEGHGEDRDVEAAMPRKTFGQRGKYRGARLANLVRWAEQRTSSDGKEAKDDTAAGQAAMEPEDKAARSAKSLPTKLATHTDQAFEEEKRQSDEEEEDEDQEEESTGYKPCWDDDEGFIPNRPVIKRPASATTLKPALSAPLEGRMLPGKRQPPASAAPILSPPLASQSRSRPPTTSSVTAGSSSASAAALAAGVGAEGSALPSSKKFKSMKGAALPLLISMEEIMDSYEGTKRRMERAAREAAVAVPARQAAGSAGKQHVNVGSPGNKSMTSSVLGKRSAAEAGLPPDEGSSSKVGRASAQAESTMGEGKEKERDTTSGTVLPASTAKKAPYMGSSSSQGTSRVINHTWQSPAPAPAPAHGKGKVQIAMPAPRSLPAPQRSPPDPLRSSAAAPSLPAVQATGASGGAGVDSSSTPAPATSSATSSLSAAGGSTGAGAVTGFISLAEARKNRRAGTTHCGLHSAPCGADVYNCLDPALGHGWCWCERCGPVLRDELVGSSTTAGRPSGGTSADEVIDID